jgi:hypothetical protein
MVLSHLTGRQVEAFYALLIASGKYTFLPELYDIFGREETIKFLEVFAGCLLKVPRVERLEELARAVGILVRIDSVSEAQKPSIVKTLAEELDLTEDRVRRIYVNTKAKLEIEYGLKVIPRGT